jgi:hypothetical protein
MGVKPRKSPCEGKLDTLYIDGKPVDYAAADWQWRQEGGSLHKIIIYYPVLTTVPEQFVHIQSTFYTGNAERTNYNIQMGFGFHFEVVEFTPCF